MKKYLPTFLILFAAGMVALSCNTLAYAQEDYGNYDNGYNNNYDYGYDDGYNSYDYNNNYNNQYGNRYDNGGVQITFNDFYTQLSPYGRWVMDPSYGRVWIANVPNFQPYATNGYWSHTNYGWTWVSNYSWGWAPFHYGRWGFSNIHGWFWVPGYQWGPAWVSWSSTADMYGWAPLAPGVSIGLNFSIGSVPVNFWTFAPRRYLGYTNIYNYYVPRTQYRTIIRRSNIISNYRTAGRGRYALGPQPREVSRSTGRAVRTTRIVNTRDASSAGLRNNELHMYRPAVRGSSATDRGAATRSATPATRSTTPATRSATPATRSTMPATRSATPATRSTTPAARPATPATRSTTPAARPATPQRTPPASRSQQPAAAAQQRAQQQRAQQQRAQQQRAQQQRAQQQRAQQQRAQQQRAQQQRVQRAAQRATQQRAQQAQRTQQRVERAQRSNTRSR